MVMPSELTWKLIKQNETGRQERVAEQILYLLPANEPQFIYPQVDTRKE